jgi:hypothetical protein
MGSSRAAGVSRSHSLMLASRSGSDRCRDKGARIEPRLGAEGRSEAAPSMSASRGSQRCISSQATQLSLCPLITSAQDYIKGCKSRGQFITCRNTNLGSSYRDWIYTTCLAIECKFGFGLLFLACLFWLQLSLSTTPYLIVSASLGACSRFKADEVTRREFAHDSTAFCLLCI